MELWNVDDQYQGTRACTLVTDLCFADGLSGRWRQVRYLHHDPSRGQPCTGAHYAAGHRAEPATDNFRHSADFAKTNQPYAFQPTASDPDGDKVTFKVYNKPAWATFDPATGKLAGTPSSSSTGKFSNITIVASDGTNSDELGPFEITVASTATTGSATLSWQPPTENADGSPLTNLAGYVIRYGTKSDALTLELKISNPGITTAMVEGLALARWYFTVSAYTTTGVESMPSAVGSKTVT